LKSFALENSKRRPVFGKDGPDLADPLKSISSPLAPNAIDAIAFFTSKPPMSKTLAPASSPMKRDPSNNEIALQLLLDNNLTISPIVKSGPLSRDLDVTLDGNAKNLSSIVSRTRSLALLNASQVDFQNLLNFPQLNRLVLNGSNIGSTPPLPRATMRLSHLGLANTKVESLNFVKAMPSLGSLDISNTPVTDLSPLASCKILRSLEAGGCRLRNLQTLQSLRSLRQLTISPELIENPKDLDALKSTAITSIRTPNDPPGQTAADFFRKYLNNKTESNE
jgi:internalin A